MTPINKSNLSQEIQDTLYSLGYDNVDKVRIKLHRTYVYINHGIVEDDDFAILANSTCTSVNCGLNSEGGSCLCFVFKNNT